MSLPDTIREVQTALGITADGVAGDETWGAVHARILGGRPAQAPAPGAAAATDERTARCVASLLQPAQERALAFLVATRATGLDVRIISGTRTYEEQDALYAQGRTKPGRIVTNARAGFSNHNFGLAFDVGIFRDGRYIEDGPEYRRIAPLGKSQGLSWGGDWQSIEDEPHYELRPHWAADLSEGQMMAELRRRKELGHDALA